MNSDKQKISESLIYFLWGTALYPVFLSVAIIANYYWGSYIHHENNYIYEGVCSFLVRHIPLFSIIFSYSLFLLCKIDPRRWLKQVCGAVSVIFFLTAVFSIYWADLDLTHYLKTIHNLFKFIMLFLAGMILFNYVRREAKDNNFSGVFLQSIKLFLIAVVADFLFSSIVEFGIIFTLENSAEYFALKKFDITYARLSSLIYVAAFINLSRVVDKQIYKKLCIFLGVVFGISSFSYFIYHWQFQAVGVYIYQFTPYVLAFIFIKIFWQKFACTSDNDKDINSDQTALKAVKIYITALLAPILFMIITLIFILLFMDTSGLFEGEEMELGEEIIVLLHNIVDFLKWVLYGASLIILSSIERKDWLKKLCYLLSSTVIITSTSSFLDIENTTRMYSQYIRSSLVQPMFILVLIILLRFFISLNIDQFNRKYQYVIISLKLFIFSLSIPLILIYLTNLASKIQLSDFTEAGMLLRNYIEYLTVITILAFLMFCRAETRLWVKYLGWVAATVHLSAFMISKILRHMEAIDAFVNNFTILRNLQIHTETLMLFLAALILYKLFQDKMNSAKLRHST